MLKIYKKSALLAVAALMAVLFVFVLSAFAFAEGEGETLPVWSGEAADSFAGGTGTEDDPYQIATAEQLAYLAKGINEGNLSTSEKYFKLTEDICLNASLDDSPLEWTPIGTLDYSFAGMFDGDGHTVSGLYINTTEVDQGLFGYCGGNIYDLRVSGSVTAGDYVGGICGRFYGGVISGCYSDVDVKGGNWIGGICGFLSAANIENCYSIGAIECDLNYAGGICGYSWGQCTIKNSINAGEVSSLDGTTGIGGICGYNCMYVDEVYFLDVIQSCYYLNSTADIGVSNMEDSEGIAVSLNAEELAVFDVDGDATVWTKGDATISNITADADNERMGTAQVKLPYLTAFGTVSQPNAEVAVYNFSIEDDTEDWQLYTPIYTAQQLQAIDDDLAGNYVLMNDIELDEPSEGKSNWTPIGLETAVDFTGKFSGDGHTIYNMVIRNSIDPYIGMFFINDGIIMDLTLEDGLVYGDFIIEGNDYYSFVGGICGRNDGTIYNCHNGNDISGTNYVGGICGILETAKFSVINCSNSGTITATSDNGTACFAGGICGAMSDGTSTPTPMVGCYNTGSVSSASGYAGGICGYVDEYALIERCYNTGDVTCTDDIDIGTSYAGGICGYQNNINIVESFNTGDISAEQYAGGICGYAVSGNVTNCYNLGEISSTGDYAGGICGYGTQYGAVSSCYNAGDVSAKTWAGAISGYYEHTIDGLITHNFYILGTAKKGVGNLEDTSGAVRVMNTTKLALFDIDGSSGTVWKSGTDIISDASADSDGSRWGTAKIRLPYLTAIDVDVQPEAEVAVYDFSVEDGLNDWQLFTPIYTAEQLQDINDDLYGNYVLMNDITLSDPAEGESNWMPIGTYVEPFAGRFNGNGYAVKNIVINDDENDFIGMFSNNRGVIMGLTVEDGSIVSGHAYAFVGGICGRNEGTIIDCHNGNSVSGEDNVGGICGNNCCVILDCSNSGDITGCAEYASFSYVGGICGYKESSYYDIKGCHNTGSITGIDGYAAGICGYVEAGSITDCYNTGDVTCTAENDSGECYAGGICGRTYGITISECYNTGNITSEQYVGGICAFTCNYVEKCYNTGKVSCPSTTYNSTTDSWAGGIVGSSSRTVSNCYNIGAVDGECWAGGICGYISDALEYCYNAGMITDGEFGGGVLGDGYDATADCYYLDGSAEGCCSYARNGYDCGCIRVDLEELSGFAPSTAWTKGSYDNGLAVLPSITGVGDAYMVCDFGAGAEVVTPIYTAEELQAINDDLSGNYLLMNDIELDAPEEGESNWTPIGNGDRPFEGNFSGNGHSVKGIIINGGNDMFQGLFGLNEGIITDVTVECEIEGNTYTGGICGYNRGTITRCISKGLVYMSQMGGAGGGICGYNNNDAIISECANYSECDYLGSRATVGGICGKNYGYVSSCYNTALIIGDYVGGICGYNYSAGEISDCYSIGDVQGAALKGAVCGESEGTVTNCWYCTDFCDAGAVNGEDTEGAEGIGAVAMTSSNALETMGFALQAEPDDPTVEYKEPKWGHKPVDKSAKTAYYPYLLSLDISTEVSYETKISIEYDTSKGEPVFGESLYFIVSALVKIDGMEDYSADTEVYTEGVGHFTLRYEGEDITVLWKIPDNTIADLEYLAGNIPAGEQKFTLRYNGSNSDFLESGSVDITVTIAEPAAPAVTAPEILSGVYNGGKIQLSWEPVEGATSYRIYRAQSLNGTKTHLKTVGITSCNDSTVVMDKVYYYYVAAYNSVTGDLSDYSEAYEVSTEVILDAPEILSADYSNGKVTLRWSACDDATSYRIYRSDSEYGTKTHLKTVGITSCNDTTAVAGNTYYYYVAAYNSLTGKLSGYSVAYELSTESDFVAPEILSADLINGAVRLSWEPVVNATSYRVYRATSINGTKTHLKTVGITSCNDSTAQMGYTYYYFVAAYNSATGELSDYSVAYELTVDSGFEAPENLFAEYSDGKVVLSWDAVDGATSYRIYRAESGKLTKTHIKTVGITSCYDTLAAAGKTYDYYVAAYNSATGELSELSAAFELTVPNAFAAPEDLTAVYKDGKVQLSWSAAEGATSYRIYRASSENGTKTHLKTVAITNCYDTTATAGNSYYYFVAAYNSATSQLSDYSDCCGIVI